MSKIRSALSELASSIPPPRRPLGNSHLSVSPVSLGCWPIAGVSSLGVNDRDSLATIYKAIDGGINFVDTAYSYGLDGEADILLAQVLKDRHDEILVASKVGSHYTRSGSREVDGRPETLVTQAQQIVNRLGVECVDVMYLHQPDPNVPIAESAGGILQIVEQGLARYAGVCNVDRKQLEAFHSVCPVIVVQTPFNILQPAAVTEIADICSAQNIGIACYWVLMKGLLAGKMQRDHQFDPQDRRLTYEVYRGQAWERAQDLLDKLREQARQLDCTVAQLVIAWTLRQPGISVALCGAKRPEQIAETALAMHLQLSDPRLEELNTLAAQF